MLKPVLLLVVTLQLFAYGQYECDTTFISSDTVIVCTMRHDDGVVVAREEYINGKPNGEQIEWYSNGEMRSISKYRNGNLIDTAYTFYPDGKMKTRIVQNGNSLTLAQNGDTLTISEVENGKPNGWAKSFFANSRKKEVTHFHLGQKHGLSESWREDGTRKDSTVYDMGEIVEIREYYASGSIRYWAKYPEGRLKWANYYTPEGKPSGKIRKGSGKCVLYSEDGQIRLFREYRDGKEVISRKLEPGEKPSLK